MTMAHSFDQLRPLLSERAQIHLSGNEDFTKLLQRWREYRAPNIAAIVSVATESDVQETIRYANQHDIPFLGRAGGHGACLSMSLAKNAIQIDLRGLDNIRVSEDGKSATIGGGAIVKNVVDSLAVEGKYTVTGICESVGFSAPILGGGHGWLQGQYGLLADQVVSARVVLPDGEVVTASDESNPDLFWALRGAGHNFGIVTEWEYKIYNMKHPKWSYEVFVYSGDKVEALFDLSNSKMKDQPPEVTQWSYIIKVPDIDPEHPILWTAIISDGPVEATREYAKPFHDIDPLSVQAGEADLHELAVLTLMHEDGPACAYGLTNQRFPIGLQNYNIASMRKVYEDIDETLRQNPVLGNTVFVIEGYSTHGVRAVDPKSTAVPYRDERVLIVPYVAYQPDEGVDKVAYEFGSRLRGHLLEGTDEPGRPTAYVNYADGDESIEAMYGWEDWRIERLRSLKKKWDPNNRMRFYLPITRV